MTRSHEEWSKKKANSGVRRASSAVTSFVTWARLITTQNLSFLFYTLYVFRTYIFRFKKIAEIEFLMK